ncbi:MAG TPA: hypothetical protein ENK44_00775 [Caldithrix abyssi]|uniref:Restriction endonuclease type I HsdR N-terminal domain-containing protein n=1 Tax=Caldithrix abyssi TaxID=187145 RepID=A0A7V4TXM3_CALAY|nr:hypothetical protein [Caldithrix abyssi]
MNNISEIWNEICYLLHDNVKNNLSEKDFETQVIRSIELLGWKEYKNEIVRQYSIKVGRNSLIRPDIVIYNSDGNAIICVEIKRPSEDMSDYNYLSQLTSYMRQMKSDFGFLIGKELRVYYDGHLNKHPDPLLIEKIEFVANNNKGLSFVKYFSKYNYDSVDFHDYLKNKIKNFNRKAEVDKLLTILVSEDTKRKIVSFLKTEFSDFGDDVLLDALNKIKINIDKIYDKTRDGRQKEGYPPKKITGKPVNTIEPPKSIGKPDLPKILSSINNSARITLAQIYSVLFYMKKGFDFPSSVKFTLSLFPDVNYYQTIADKCGRRFAGDIPTFEEWFKSGEMLYHLRAKYSLSNFEYDLFKKLLSS